MKKLVGKFGILILAVSSAFSLGAWAQTTNDGPGPTEQPSAPMEIGQGQDGQPPDAQQSEPPQGSDQPNDAEPTEAAPGGPTGEAPAQTDQGVARISLIHGDVSTQRGDSGDWSAAALNQPVMTGDKVSTGENARTEMQLDFANTIRLASHTKINIANLTQKNIQIQVGEGMVTYAVTKDSEAEPEIDTPNVSVHPSHHDGVFRVEVHPDGDTVVIVRQGEAQIATPQGSTEVRSGEMATIRGNAESAQYKISSAPDRDDWDRWNSDRDHMIRDANSWHHTNRYYTGSQDLDAYGKWRHVDDYGDVWYPDEPSDWSPYRDGNWVYQPYYGWTWVGYEPWGWAPYHYGRWLWYGGSWGWWPGPVYSYYRPFWAPAYVSFWGWGGGFGFGVGFGGWGGFGWLPLGPCDWYHPWWGGYRGRFGWVGRGWAGGVYGGIHPLHNGIRFSNVTNIRDVHISRAMSTVNAGRFGAGRYGAVAARPEQLSGAHMMAGNLPVVPSRASLSASGRAASTSTMRNGGAQRFFGTHNNNMVRTASFAQQTASLRQSMQQSHVGAIPAGGFAARGTMQRPSAGIPANNQVNSGNRPNGSTNGGYRSTTVSNNSGRSAEPMRGTAQSQSGGYRPFTPPNSSNRSETNSSGFSRNEPARGTSQPSTQNENRGGYRSFTPPNSSNRAPEGNQSNRPSETNNSGFSRGEPERGTSQAAQQSENRSGFRPFTPPSRSEMSNSNSSRGSNGSYWNRTAPTSSAPHGYTGRGSYAPSGSARPQLDMRQPIARTPSYGGSRGYPGYGGPSRSMPSSGGSHGAPSYGGGRAPSGGGGGGHVGGGGGGHSSGGGGGGGGHSGGGGHGGHR